MTSGDPRPRLAAGDPTSGEAARMVPPVTWCKGFVVATAEAEGVLRSRLRLAENVSFTMLLILEML